MPRASTTQQIPQHDWENRKSRIIELYVDQELKLRGNGGVIELMKNEGFTATKSQYETQLKKWSIRKYFSSKELDGMASGIHGSQEGAQTLPLRLSGKVMTPSKIERSRRYARSKYKKPRLDAGNDETAAMNNATTPILNGPEHSTSQGFLSEASHGLTSGNMGRSSSDEILNFDYDADAPLPDAFDDILDMSTPQHLNSFTMDITHINVSVSSETSGQVGSSFGSPKSMSPVGELNPVDFSFGDIIECISTNHVRPIAWNSHGSTALSPPCISSPAFLVPDVANTKRYPREQWIGQLPSVEVRIRFLKDVFSTASSPSPYNTMSSTAPYLLVAEFLTDITPSDPKTSTLPQQQALRNLLSEETLVEEEQSQLAIQSKNNAFETRFYSRLLISIMNGFVGLKNIPMSGVLRFLNSHRGVQSFLIRFLRSGSSCAAKSLAENTFVMALEADNVEVVRLLLDCGLVDVNEAVCIDNGKRYTPLEKAARSQSFKICKLLVNRNYDIHKSFSSGSPFSNPRELSAPAERLIDMSYELETLFLPDSPSNYALCYLVRGYRNYRSTLDQSFLDLINAFVRAGATIQADLIVYALEMFVDPRLAAALIPVFTLQVSLERFLDSDILKKAVVNLDQDTWHAIGPFITRCRELYDSQCPDHFRGMFIDALKSAAQRNNARMIKQLLPFVSSLDDVLHTVAMDGNHEMVDLIIEEKSIVEVQAEEARLIAAVASGKQELVHSLEERRVLDRLNNSKRIDLAATALEARNPEYAGKVLDMDTNADSDQLNPLLMTAITHDLDDIAWKLLVVGAKFEFKLYCTIWKPFPLYLAMKKRKLRLVQYMIESGIHPSTLTERVEAGKDKNNNPQYSSVLAAAIEWGNESILQDILGTCSHHLSINYRDPTLKLALEKGRQDLFWRILKLGHGNKETLSRALCLAVEREDVSLLRDLFAFGVDPADTYALEKAAEGHPSMIEPLVKRFREVYPQGQPLYISRAMLTALGPLLAALKSLDNLLAFKVASFDFDSSRFYRKSAFGEAINPDDEALRGNRIQIVKRLLDAGADANGIVSMELSRIFNYKQSAILDAIETKNVEVVQLLLRYGARVNEPARQGLIRTPLQKAAEMGSLEIVHLLLGQKAEVNAAPALNNGATALQLAAISGNCTIAALLIERGANFDIPPSRDKYGRWPLEGAAENGRLDMIQLLWNANRGSFDDKQCQKAMRLAEDWGHFGCRDKILELMATRMAAQPTIDQFPGGTEDIDLNTFLDIPWEGQDVEMT
ncbi:ankyrin [Hypoxylon trugodes]|uniref:ankyrin n=1 Tax=Hypoxylon trugodes TaxID=326681 RepID=UPI00219B596B|nr:ankyrin [Hypoxylon trugodes]KAI1390063.1 ankyrin [Hypoxylon trugodes]